MAISFQSSFHQRCYCIGTIPRRVIRLWNSPSQKVTSVYFGEITVLVLLGILRGHEISGALREKLMVAAVELSF